MRTKSSLDGAPACFWVGHVSGDVAEMRASFEIYFGDGGIGEIAFVAAVGQGARDC